MKKAHCIPVFVTLAFGLGSVLGFYPPLNSSWCLKAGLVVLCLFLITFIRSHRQLFQDWLFPFSAFLMLIVLGYFNTWIHQPAQQPQHYIHRDLTHSYTLVLKIREALHPNPYNANYIAEIQQMNHHLTSGRVLFSIYKDSTTRPLHVDDNVVLKAKFESIYAPLNPYQFNYAAYMANKNILKEVRVNPEEYFTIPAQEHSILGRAAQLRRHVDSVLHASDFSPHQIALMEALLLGQRDAMSASSYQHFIDAGVVHVLAVSGLHIGILLMLLLFVLKPLTFLPHGRLLRSLVAILLLWGYACVVGLSASILRSVCMFSFLSLGLLFKRRVSTINMLCLSAVALWLYDPSFLLQVGFQLSYAAVLSILIFHKKINRIFHFKNKPLKYLWSISSVTLAAQLGVLPLSLFYFHQLPGLFFVMNLAIVPFMGIIIGAGVVVILLAVLNYLPHVIVIGYGKILHLLQWAVDWAASKENFILQHLYFSLPMLVISCITLVFLGFYLYRKKVVYLLLFLFGIISFQLSCLRAYKAINKQHLFYVFYKSRHTVLGFQNGHNLQLISDLSKKKLRQLSFINSFQSAQNITHLKSHQGLKNYYRFGHHRLFIIDSAGVWQLPKSIHPTAILLRNSPEINLTRLLDSLHPRLIIADGSNYKSVVAHWKATCSNSHTPFYYTGKKGAYKLAY